MPDDQMTSTQVAAEVVRAVRKQRNARADRRKQTTRRIRKLAKRTA